VSARRSRRPGGDAGTTLAEMLVALIVFGVFAAFVSTTVLQTTRLAKTSALREGAAQSASLVLQQLSRDLRTAVRLGPTTAPQTAFVAATPTEVVFFSNVEPEILRERLYVSGGELFRETKRPDPTSTFPELTYTSTDPARTTTRRIATAAVQTAGLFTYYVKAAPTVPLTTVAAADLRDLSAVAVQVALDPDGAGALKPVVLTTTVRPYNP
jgi:prepilin-type N-terminal cleavage/methylation domain-containing protein